MQQPPAPLSILLVDRIVGCFWTTKLSFPFLLRKQSPWFCFPCLLASQREREREREREERSSCVVSFLGGSMDFLMSSSYDAVLRLGIQALEANVVPDFVLRRATRALLKRRLNSLNKSTGEEQLQALMSFVQCAFSFLLYLSQYFCFLSYNVIGWLLLGAAFLRWKGIKKKHKVLYVYFSLGLHLVQNIPLFELHASKVWALTCTFSSFWLEISCFHIGHSFNF